MVLPNSGTSSTTTPLSTRIEGSSFSSKMKSRRGIFSTPSVETGKNAFTFRCDLCKFAHPATVTLRDINNWTSEQVYEWLKQLCSGRFEIRPESIIEEQIDGAVLLELTHEILKEAGVKAVGHRQFILGQVRQLKKCCISRLVVNGSTSGKGSALSSLTPATSSGTARQVCEKISLEVHTLHGSSVKVPLSVSVGTSYRSIVQKTIQALAVIEDNTVPVEERNLLLEDPKHGISRISTSPYRFYLVPRDCSLEDAMLLGSMPEVTLLYLLHRCKNGTSDCLIKRRILFSRKNVKCRIKPGPSASSAVVTTSQITTLENNTCKSGTSSAMTTPLTASSPSWMASSAISVTVPNGFPKDLNPSTISCPKDKFEAIVNNNNSKSNNSSNNNNNVASSKTSSSSSLTATVNLPKSKVSSYNLSNNENDCVDDAENFPLKRHGWSRTSLRARPTAREINENIKQYFPGGLPPIPLVSCSSGNDGGSPKLVNNLSRDVFLSSKINVASPHPKKCSNSVDLTNGLKHNRINSNLVCFSPIVVTPPQPDDSESGENESISAFNIFKENRVNSPSLLNPDFSIGSDGKSRGSLGPKRSASVDYSFSRGNDSFEGGNQKQQCQEEQGQSPLIIFPGNSTYSPAKDAAISDDIKSPAVGYHRGRKSSLHKHKITKYSLGQILGQGSFGTVYMCVEAVTLKLYALKRVRIPDLEANSRKQDILNAIQIEIDLLKQLDHCNVVQYIDSNHESDNINIFLEYVEGGTLKTLIAENNGLDERHIRSFSSQILNGLSYIHSLNVIHRDIKASNILVTRHGKVKISDFGISKKIENDPSLQGRYSKMKGTIYWMAPETVRDSNKRKPSGKIDIWGLGCVIIEMITNCPHPWAFDPSCCDSSGCSVLFKLGNMQRPKIPDCYLISRRLKDFIDQCLLVDPDQRPDADILASHRFLREGSILHQLQETQIELGSETETPI